jgi:hypothetical protein
MLSPSPATQSEGQMQSASYNKNNAAQQAHPLVMPPDAQEREVPG